MLDHLTQNFVTVINALGGSVLTFSAAAAFAVRVISNRIARESSMSSKIKHAETVVAEANRHAEKIALLKANDPKVIEGLSKQISRD